MDELAWEECTVRRGEARTELRGPPVGWWEIPSLGDE